MMVIYRPHSCSVDRFVEELDVLLNNIPFLLKKKCFHSRHLSESFDLSWLKFAKI